MEQLLQLIGERDLVIGKVKKPLIIAGPCVIEDPDLMMKTAEKIVETCADFDLPVVFKSSYDKANRTSVESYRGPGIKVGLSILYNIKRELGVPVISDIHSVDEIEEAAKVLDIIQIPAFLCRQTDILVEAGNSGKVVNIKKGQFMAPEDMHHAVEKVRSTGNKKVLITERGTSFGYNNLVVDMRSLEIMREFAPVIFDATHSVQRPAGLGNISGGDRKFVPALTRAAVAAGVYGLFLEVHPDPDKAKSDAATQLPLHHFPRLIEETVQVFNLVNSFPQWSV